MPNISINYAMFLQITSDFINFCAYRKVSSDLCFKFLVIVDSHLLNTQIAYFRINHVGESHRKNKPHQNR